MKLVAGIAALGCFLVFSSGYAHEHSDHMPIDAKLGTVSFQISCKPELQVEFNRAIALLHSFWKDEAEHLFEKIVAADPDCAMAYWGEAMTYLPTPLAAGTQALARADAAREKTPREAAYIQALHVFYNDFKSTSATAHAKQYSEAMGAVAGAYPEDLEAKVFYALALIAADAPEDIDLANHKKAVAILSPLFREHPDHPGIAHYLIHACDNPAMAHKGLQAARHYALIAPASPHALHMPSHIFARLGLWQDDIRSNLASKAATKNLSGILAFDRMHAMEFLEYAYLQSGREDEARAILVEAKTIESSQLDPRDADWYPYAEAAYPAIFAIETQDWTMAAHLEPVAGDAGTGPTLLARTIAAAHLHDTPMALESVRMIDSLIEKDQPPTPNATPDTTQEEIHAWASFAQGDLDRAASLLRPIAERQAQVGHYATELPARGMLADMFLLNGRYADALAEYQASLVSDPNRFNDVLGAARAAERLGQRQLAARYYRMLLANCAGANGNTLVELRHARTVVQ